MRSSALLRLGLAVFLSCLGPARAFAQSDRAALDASQASSTIAEAPGDEEPYLLYQLRPGEDPSKIAKNFQVSLDELLTLNQIGDPHRLAAGALLKIPDQRARLVLELRDERDTLRRELADARAKIDALDGRLRDLGADLDALRRTSEDLAARQAWYRALRVAFWVATGLFLTLAIVLIVVAARARDDERRRRLAVRHAESLRAAVEKYRQLSAQFELKYQSLFRQAGTSPGVQEKAQALRRLHESEIVRLDASLEDEQRAIAEVEKLPPARESRDGRTRPARVPTTRTGT
ncbi:MAG TPA: LysM peptidoglycan-binding domain-containing protein [Candidatus Bathyarchaeia archaeon]|nr:LysM peptidoglycan-binding domain-containing protein [Candidatus Bathyarchaeia archaeon]